MPRQAGVKATAETVKPEKPEPPLPDDVPAAAHTASEAVSAVDTVEAAIPGVLAKPAEIVEPPLAIRQPLAAAQAAAAEALPESAATPAAPMAAQTPMIIPETAAKPIGSMADIEYEPVTFTEFSASLPPPVIAETAAVPFDWEAFDALVAPNYALLQASPEDELPASGFVDDGPEAEVSFGEDLALAYDWLGLAPAVGDGLEAEHGAGVRVEAMAADGPPAETGTALAAETGAAVDSTRLGEQIDERRQELAVETAELVDQTWQQLNEALSGLAAESLVPAPEVIAEVFDESTNVAAGIEPDNIAEQLAAVSELCVTLLEQLSLPTDEATIQALVGLLAPDLAEIFKVPADGTAVSNQPADDGTHEILLEGTAQDSDDSLGSLVDRLKLSWYGSIASRNQLAV